MVYISRGQSHYIGTGFGGDGLGGGGGGGGTMPPGSITNFSVGDLPAGTDISGQSAVDVLTQMLIGYVEPIFSSFTVSGFPSNGNYEMGNAFTVGSPQTFSWNTTPSTNVQPNSISIQDVTNSATMATGLNDDSSETLPLTTGPITFDPSTPGIVSQQYRILGTDTNANNFQRNFTRNYRFVYPIFEGLVTNISDIFNGMTRADITSLPLSTQVIPQQNRTVTTTPTAQRYAFVYPQAYGNLSSVIDNNGFETITDYTIVDFNLTGMLDGASVPYRAYILNNLTTQASPFTNNYIF